MSKSLELSGEERALAIKLRAFVIARKGAFTSDALRSMFDEYDANHDGRISKPELDTLLDDAAIGNRLTRPLWVLAVMHKLDTNSDKHIDWQEFSSALTALEAQLPPL